MPPPPPVEQPEPQPAQPTSSASASAVARATLPTFTVTAADDNEHSAEDDHDVAARIAAARVAAVRAAAALQAGKEEANKCPPGERSMEALDKVFTLELAKSAADQTFANLLDTEASRKLANTERARAPTPGAGVGAPGLWTNLWPLAGVGGMSLAPLAVATVPHSVDAVDNSKARFALLREVDEKNGRLNELLRQLRNPALTPEQRSLLEEELARAQQAKDEVDTKLRPLLEAVVVEQRRAVEAAARRLEVARASGDEGEIRAADEQMKRAEGALKDVLRQLAGLGTGELVAVKAKAAADAAAAEAAANTLKADLAALQAKVAADGAVADALRAELRALADKLAELQRSNAEHEGRAKAAAAELQAAENETAAAKRLVEALEDAVRKGSASSSALTAQVADLTKSSADQAAALAATNHTIEAWEASDRANAEELAALRKRIADLEAQRQRDIDDIASGRASLSEMAAERAAGQQRADALQVRYLARARRACRHCVPTS